VTTRRVVTKTRATRGIFLDRGRTARVCERGVVRG
jgi:hypothetical protein